MAEVSNSATAEAEREPAEASRGGPTERVFSMSIAVSAVRCTLAYAIFPWVLPAAGAAGGVGPAFGLAIGAVAMVFNAVSIRRFWQADHRFKQLITVLNSGVMALLAVMAAIDLSDLLN